MRNAFKYKLKLDEQAQQKRNQIWNLTLNPKTFLRMDHSVTLYFVSSDFSFSHFLLRCLYSFSWLHYVLLVWTQNKIHIVVCLKKNIVIENNFKFLIWLNGKISECFALMKVKCWWLHFEVFQGQLHFKNLWFLWILRFTRF